MEEILHQLRLVVYHIIYRVLYIPGGARFLPSTVRGPYKPGKPIYFRPFKWDMSNCTYNWFLGAPCALRVTILLDLRMFDAQITQP